jgi:hypothetical protein
MITKRALLGLFGVLTVVAMSTSGSALAAGAGSSPRTSNTTPATLVEASCSAGARACPIRLTFAKGAYSGQAHSTLTGIHSEKWFVVHANAGQTMVVIVKGHGPTRGIVYFPNGKSSGQPGGRVFDEVLPVTGDYRIRVNESPMGEAWSGGVDVVAVIY